MSDPASDGEVAQNHYSALKRSKWRADCSGGAVCALKWSLAWWQSFNQTYQNSAEDKEAELILNNASVLLKEGNYPKYMQTPLTVCHFDTIYSAPFQNKEEPNLFPFYAINHFVKVGVTFFVCLIFRGTHFKNRWFFLFFFYRRIY